MANTSGCGKYYPAKDSSQLANVFIELRHASMGNILLQKQGNISQGEQLQAGTASVPAGTQTLLATLNWPGSKLELVIKDPSGQQIDPNGANVTYSETPTLVSIILKDPKPGDYQIGIVGQDVPEGTTVYNLILSSRAGATPPPQPVDGGMLFVILAVVISGGGVAMYAMSRTMRPKVRAMPKTARLTGVSGPAVGQEVALFDQMIIGRGSASSLQIQDPAVSRSHALIRYADGRWYIQDQGSQGGTYVNGQRVTATVLKNGDQIQIGTSIWVFNP